MKSLDKVLILGGSGFIGQELVSALDFHMIAPIRKMSNQNNLILRDSVEYIEFNEFMIADALKKCKVVLYLIEDISFLQERAPDFKKYTSEIFLHKILERLTNHHHIVYMSSRLVYGPKFNFPVKETDKLDPDTLYGKSKLYHENLITSKSNEYGFSYTILRPTNVYTLKKRTTSNNIINVFYKAIIEQRELCVYGSGNQIRDYANVDVLSILLSIILKSKGSNDVINVGSSIGTSINEIVEIFQEFSRNSFKVKQVDVNVDEGTFIADCSKMRGLIDVSTSLKCDVATLLECE